MKNNWYINKGKFFLFILIITVLLVVSSCVKAECKIDANCASKTCSLSKCENKKCVYTIQKNCCGNSVKENIEDGKTGNKCTCSKDYGKCEGKGKVKPRTKLEDATYVHYYCNSENKCILGVEEKNTEQQNFLDQLNIGFFKASIIFNYKKPFDVGKDSVSLKLTLDDISKDLVLPIQLTKVNLLFTGENARTEQIISEQIINLSLNEIGGKALIDATSNLGYKPKELEESGSLRYSIDYSYVKKVATGKAPDGTKLYTDETVRSTFSSPTKKVFLIRSEVSD